MSAVPDRPITVSVPARFAGGAVADLALNVIRAAGWTLVADPDANVHARNPGGLVYAGWLPEADGPWTWRIHCTDVPFAAPVWTADFSQDVPTAAVAAYLTALLDEPGYERDPFTATTLPGGPACPGPATARALLMSAGWETEHLDARTVEARHGDGDLLAAHGVPPGMWHIPWPLRRGSGWGVLCTVGAGGPEVWRAVFEGDAPMRAVAAFLAAVTDPEPVPRHTDELHPQVAARHT